MFCTDNTVPLLKVPSCSNISFMMFRTGSMGTDVNNAVASMELRHSPGRWIPSSLTYKVAGTLYVMKEFTYQGLKYLGNDPGHTIGDRNPARYKRPKGGTSFMDFLVIHRTWGQYNW